MSNAFFVSPQSLPVRAVARAQIKFRDLTNSEDLRENTT
jgi:hypothetical protein